MAAMTATNGSTTAATLTLRCKRVTGLEATTEKGRSFRALPTFEREVLVGFPQMPPAISDLLEAGRARAKDAFAERMPRGFGRRRRTAPTPARACGRRRAPARRPAVGVAAARGGAGAAPELPALADEIVAAVSDGVPDYARPLEGEFGRALRAGVEDALGQFVAAMEDPEAARATGRETYVEPRPRRDARGPRPRRPARRLSDRRPRRLAPAGRRRRAGRPAAGHAVFARRGDLRLYRRAVGRLDRGLRARAGGRGGRPPAPPPAPRDAARPGAAAPRPRPWRPPPPTPAGRCRARSPPSRWRGRRRIGLRCGWGPRRWWRRCRP